MEFYTVEEFADILKVKPRQVYKWIKERRIHALRLNNTQKSPWRIPQRELSRLDASCYQDDDT